ncbi:hypothetical protein GUU_00862 [Malacoplasma iowae 695]|nr:hypothetical protein GUU_00862 [Malacoplasma iowae 695]
MKKVLFLKQLKFLLEITKTFSLNIYTLLLKTQNTTNVNKSCCGVFNFWKIKLLFIKY